MIGLKSVKDEWELCRSNRCLVEKCLELEIEKNNGVTAAPLHYFDIYLSKNIFTSTEID